MEKFTLRILLDISSQINAPHDGFPVSTFIVERWTGENSPSGFPIMYSWGIRCMRRNLNPAKPRHRERLKPEGHLSSLFLLATALGLCKYKRGPSTHGHELEGISGMRTIITAYRGLKESFGNDMNRLYPPYPLPGILRQVKAYTSTCISSCLGYICHRTLLFPSSEAVCCDVP
ncbi:hypothetical protein GGR54DRAFT_351252 [Hypoxylon sp. NC1633]|nr:hypothetical protein GGR54DRAFT_351252 [Hypoxylon sp. NC1633]